MDFAPHPHRNRSGSDPDFPPRYGVGGDRRRGGFNNQRISGSASSHILPNEMHNQGQGYNYRRNQDQGARGSRDRSQNFSFNSRTVCVCRN